MADMRVLEAADIGAELRQPQLLRHLALEHAALAVVAHAFARDDEHEAGALALRPVQEPQQRSVRLTLGLAVQIEAGVDLDGAARQSPLQLAIEQPGMRRRLRRRGRHADRWRRARARLRLARHRWRSSGIGWRLASPQWCDRTRDPAPERALVVAQLAPLRLAVVRAHVPGFGRAGPACWRDFFGVFAASSVLPTSGLGSSSFLPFAGLLSDLVDSDLADSDLADSDLAPAGLDLPSFLTSLPSPFLAWSALPSSAATSSSGIFGFATGSGMFLPAAIMSSSRGSSMTKRPGWRMRPAMRAASSPAPQ